MMRIGFVGDASDARGGSPGFFLDILEQIGDVTVLRVDADGGMLAGGGVIRTLLDHRFDCTIFWRTDRLARQLTPLGLERCFLVPADNEAWHSGPEHWQSLVGHHVLSFSRGLHETVVAAHGRSSYFQYFPEPRQLPDRDFERAADVLRTFRSGKDSEDVTDSLFHFVPPESGDGSMAMVEAMASGRIVVAVDRSPANDYVAHLVSGLLHPPGETPDLPRLDAAALRAMSAAAHRKVVEGRHTWLMDIERLVSILRDEDRRWPTGDHSSHFAARIRHAAHKRLADGV